MTTPNYSLATWGLSVWIPHPGSGCWVCFLLLAPLPLVTIGDPLSAHQVVFAVAGVCLDSIRNNVKFDPWCDKYWN